MSHLPVAFHRLIFVSDTISVPEDTPAVIVLRQLDTRYYQDISGSLAYTFEFVVYRKGSNEECAVSPRGQHYDRSQSVEVDLKAGEYVVHVRIQLYRVLYLTMWKRFAWMRCSVGKRFVV